MVGDEKLEEFLTASGLKWLPIPPDRHVSLRNEWNHLYGNCFNRGQRIRHRQGARAQEEYSHESAEVFLIVPFLGGQGGPHSIRKRGPRVAAYECSGDGTLPDLSPFATVDFFVVPPDLTWTMVHTHEDYAFGGPYFIRKEWIVPPTRKGAW